MITDLSMPGMDGATLIREARKKHPGLKAILVTGYLPNNSETFEGIKANEVVMKPVQQEQLREVLMSLLGAG